MRDTGEYLFTSESVSEGHPDKVADRISDTVLDTFLEQDPYARVACETLVTTNRIIIAGETRGPGSITPELLMHRARLAVHDIGYEQEGFHWANAHVECHLHAQSAHIAQGVDAAGNKDEGAGDQGIMFGYACTETPDLMPAPLYYAHLILRRISEMRRNGDVAVKGLLPDAKSQVTLKYVNGKPVGATSVVVSTQHEEGLDSAQIKAMLKPIIETSLPAGWMCADAELYVNPTGTFIIGGPDGDCGLTGRKIIVDTYGGAARMAAAPSPARIRRRSTARPPMPRATWPRTSWPRAWPTSAPSRSATRSAWRSRSRCISTWPAPARTWTR
jgi:S-adenosylmethionine synthetase